MSTEEIYRGEIETLRRGLADAREQIELMQARGRDLRNENEQLRQVLAACQKALREMKEQKEYLAAQLKKK